jgi:hypothetical protein
MRNHKGKGQGRKRGRGNSILTEVGKQKVDDREIPAGKIEPLDMGPQAFLPNISYLRWLSWALCLEETLQTYLER